MAKRIGDYGKVLTASRDNAQKLKAALPQHKTTTPARTSPHGARHN